jgi:hypothetical protein
MIHSPGQPVRVRFAGLLLSFLLFPSLGCGEQKETPVIDTTAKVAPEGNTIPKSDQHRLKGIAKP